MIKKKEKTQNMEKIGSCIKNKFLNSVFLIVLFQLSLAHAAQVDVQATVDRNQMAVGDSFNLNIRVQADEDVEINPPPNPQVSGLEVLNSWAGARQSSSSMTMINGKADFKQTISQDYNFMMSPQKEGTFIIPSLNIQVSGKSYQTNPIKIQVAKEFKNSARVQPKNKRVPGRPQFPGFPDDEDLANPFGGGSGDDEDDLFNQLMKQRQQLLNQFKNGGGGGFFGQQQPRGAIPSRKLDVNVNEPFFVYLDLDKSEVYEGEQITANWYIYTRGQIESLDRAKFPDLKGFWKEIIEEVPALQFSPEIVNGVQFNKALLASHALFPIKPGIVTIDEFKIKAKVRQASQFGWGGLQSLTKSSKRITLKVLPLPTEGKPSSFSGAVGSYQMHVQADTNSAVANQPFSLKIKFEGEGNAKMIDLPPIQWPVGLEVFDTKTESKFFKDGLSFKEFEVLLVAKQPGDLLIPKIEFSFFNPKLKKYVTVNSDEIKMSVAEGGASPSQVTATSNQQKTQPVVSEETKFQPILEWPQGSVAFSQYKIKVYILIFILGFLYLLVQFVLQLKGFKQEAELPILVNRKLKMIEDFLKQKESEEVFRKIGSESLNLIYLLAAYLAGQRRANQEWTELVKEIPLQAQAQFLSQLTQLFDYFQLLGFSPAEVQKQLLQKNPLSAQIDLIKKISQQILQKARQDEHQVN